MPPKSYQVQRSGGAAAQQSNTGYARAVINELASPENRSVVTAVTMFAVCSSSVSLLFFFLNFMYAFGRGRLLENV